MKKSRRKSARSAAARRPYGRSVEADTHSSSEPDDGTSDGRFAHEEFVSYRLGIPMRDRQFPASFWVQPMLPSRNVHQPLGPHQSRGGELLETRTTAIRIPTPPDTNLLFSLFKILEHHRRRAVAASSSLLTASNAAAASHPSVNVGGQKRQKQQQLQHRSSRVRSRPSRSQHSSHKSDGAAVVESTVSSSTALPDLVADTTHADATTNCANRRRTSEEADARDDEASVATFKSNPNNSSIADDDVDRIRNRDARGDDDDNDDDDNVSSEDPYLTAHSTAGRGGRQANEMLMQADDRRRSMLMLMADRHHAASSATSAAGGSCFSDLLSDLVVNL